MISKLFSKKMRKKTLIVGVFDTFGRTGGLRAADKGGTSDPFVELRCGKNSNMTSAR